MFRSLLGPRAAALVLAAAVVTVPAVVIQSAQPAAAWAPVPVIPSVGDAVGVGAGVVGGEEAAAAGLVCSTGVGCVVLGVAAVGALAYATRDSWMPYVQSWFGSSGAAPGADPSTGVASGCDATASWLVMPVAGASVGPQVQWSGPAACGNNARHATFNYTMVCQDNTTGATSANEYAGASNTWTTGGATTVTATLSYCGSKSTPLSYSVSQDGGVSGGGVNFSSIVWLGQPQTPSGLTNTTTVTCQNATTGATSQVSLSGPATKGLPVPTCASLGSGWGAQSAKATSCLTASLSSPGAQTCQTIGQWTPDATKPLCTVAAHCVLAVYYQGTKCVAGLAGCVDWATGNAAHPTDYSCHLGSYVVSMDYCSVLEFAYGDPTLVTDPGMTDGDPSTPSTRPTWTQGTVSPTSSPTTTTGTGSSPSASSTAPAAGIPTAGTYPTPAATGIPAPDPTGDPSGQGCLGAAWSWNPVDWVMVPVQCALRWAFVPAPTAVQTSLDSIQTDLTNTTPGLWVNAVGALAPKLSVQESGCQGPALDLSSMGLGAFHGVVGVIHPFDACSGVMATAAGVTKALLTLSMCLFGTLACVRALGSGFGWSPAVGGGS